MLQVHNILLQMCNLFNSLQTAYITDKDISVSPSGDCFVELQRISLSSTLSKKQTQIDIQKQRETRRQSNLAIAASNTRCNEALLMSFAHGLRPEFRFPNGLYYLPNSRFSYMKSLTRELLILRTVTSAD